MRTIHKPVGFNWYEAYLRSITRWARNRGLCRRVYAGRAYRHNRFVNLTCWVGDITLLLIIGLLTCLLLCAQLVQFIVSQLGRLLKWSIKRLDSFVTKY